MNMVCYEWVCFERSVLSGLLWAGLFWTVTNTDRFRESDCDHEPSLLKHCIASSKSRT